MALNWQWFEFDQLTPRRLYGLLQLRQDVFVIEQDCLYPDLDGKDLESRHLVGEVEGQVVATARLLPPGISYEQVSLGRVVVHPSYRGTGLGKVLLEKTVAGAFKFFGPVDIRISAQCYLEKYYREFGFEVIGASYLEDGIPHYPMLRDKTWQMKA